MSRRKQSNPKPLKRKSDDVLEAVSESHRLPRDLLLLKDPEDEAQEYAVFTKESLREGYVFGPYGASLILDDGHGRDSPLHIIQGCDGKDNPFRLLLQDDAGWWLRLLRPASCQDDANVTLNVEGSDVWCTISTALKADTELLVSYQIFDEEVQRQSTSSTDLNQNYCRSPKKPKCVSPKSLQQQPRWKVRVSSRGHDSENDPVDDERRKNQSPDYGPMAYPDSNGRYEASSPSSPPCATSPPPELHLSSTQSATDNGDNVARMNGHRNSTAFPYATSNADAGGDGLYQCLSCSVKFTSHRTLQVHQLYYCAQRHSSAVVNSDTDSEDATVKSEHSPINEFDCRESIPPKRIKTTSKQYLDTQLVTALESSSTSISSRKNSLPSGHNRLFRCPFCRYSSDKKASLTRHVRMHGNSSMDHQSDLPICTPPLARYCANCDIQFASYKNYQVHKQFYCSTRHVHKSMVNAALHSPSQQSVPGRRASPEKPSTTTSSQDSNPYNIMMNQPLYAAISTSPLILVPCSYVAGGGLSPAAGLIPAGNIILPNAPSASSSDSETNSQGPNIIPTYTVMPSTGTVSTPDDPVEEKPPIVEEKSSPRRNSVEMTDVLPERKSLSPQPKVLCKEDSEKPLDLSFRRATEKHAVKNLVTSKNSVLPSTPIVSTSSETPLPIFPIVHPQIENPRNVPILNDFRKCTPAASEDSPVIPKQGTSKCKECNIVFYKHENYVVHKTLYCASRVRPSDSVSPESGRIVVDEDLTDNETAGTQEAMESSSPVITFPKTPEPADAPNVVDRPNRSPTTNSSVVLQFYCMACGIKFTSLDNLTAHQTYYCPKRELVSNPPVGVVPSVSRGDFRCSKCKNTYSSEDALRQHPCPVQRKCPYCDVYCPTLSATQRHLVTHTGVKSFRCSLCGYKGHTLRGMRTHIRIHLDKNNTTPEEAYILCVDERGSEIGSISRKHSKNSGSERIGSDSVYNNAVVATLSTGGTQAIIPSDMSAKKILPDMVSDQVVSGDVTHWCQICGYSSSYKGNVVRHVKLVHKDLMATQSMASIVNSRPNAALNECKHLENTDTAVSGGEEKVNLEFRNSKTMVNGISVKQEPSQRVKLSEEPMTIKSESLSPPPVSNADSRACKRSLSVEGQSSSSSSSSSSASVSSKVGPKYCKYCDISFNYLSNFIAHKKFYCMPRPGELLGQDAGPVQPVQ